MTVKYPGVSDDWQESLVVKASVDGSVVTNSTLFPYDALTTVTYSAVDSSSNAYSCTVKVNVTDTQAPHMSCDDLGVLGSTDTDKPYGTQGTSKVTLKYPRVSDNSKESLVVKATVDGSVVTNSTPFPYDTLTTVTYSAGDFYTNASADEVHGEVTGVQAPHI